MTARPGTDHVDGPVIIFTVVAFAKSNGFECLGQLNDLILEPALVFAVLVIGH
jgi:hypothetical protein